MYELTDRGRQLRPVLDEVLHVNVRDGAVQTLQGPAPVPEVVLEADRELFLAWGTGQLDDEQALAASPRGVPRLRVAHAGRGDGWRG